MVKNDRMTVYCEITSFTSVVCCVCESIRHAYLVTNIVHYRKTRKNNAIIFQYSEPGSNRHGHYWPQDFKSGVSTYSTIRATAFAKKARQKYELIFILQKIAFLIRIRPSFRTPHRIRPHDRFRRTAAAKLRFVIETAEITSYNTDIGRLRLIYRTAAPCPVIDRTGQKSRKQRRFASARERMTESGTAIHRRTKSRSGLHFIVRADK